MMQYKQLTTSLCTLALAFGSLGASAAELGDIAPRSYIGQPLAVDIDLMSLTPEEVGGLQVRLAQADVYRGANVKMNPALASVQMAVERRGGKPVLHVSTSRVVDADFVHLYVELGVPGKQEVRLATVWLQRDPNPPPPPAPVVMAVPAAPAVPLASAMTPAQAEQIAAQARAARAAAASAGTTPVAAAATSAAPGAAGPVASTSATSAASASAAQVAAPTAPARDRIKPAPLPSMHEAQVGVPGEVKAAARRIAGVMVSADGKPMKPSAREESSEVPVGVAQALLPLAPLPLPKGVKRPAPASCAPTGMSAKECVALDQHNAELSGKLVELEARLKAVQGAIGGAAAKTGAAKATAPAAASAAPASVPAPASAPTAAATRAAAGAASSAPTPGHAAAAAASAPAAGSGHASALAPGHASASATASAPAAASGHASASAAAAAAGSAHASAASASAPAKAAGGKDASSAQASASLSAQGETESHAAQASSGEAAASGAASAASAASVPTKQVRVLPKLKYKKEKEKQPEQATNYTIPLIAGGVGLVALLGAGLIFWHKKSAGRGPLKIWQGFRKKKVETPKTEPVAEDTPEAAASNA
ncbi:type IV pilus assembly protein FimV [Duganella sp. PWIR1]